MVLIKYIYVDLSNDKVEYNDIYLNLLEDRVIFIFDDITHEIASKTIASLLFLNKKSKTKDITIYINSPGGEVSAGLAIYDMMQYINAPVKTICIGRAYSAAADLLAGGSPGKRIATINSEIMIHGIQLDISGSFKEIQEEEKRYREIYSKSVKMLAYHTGQKYDKVYNDCKKDKYFTAEQALEYGLIDKILKPKRSKIKI